MVDDEAPAPDVADAGFGIDCASGVLAHTPCGAWGEAGESHCAYAWEVAVEGSSLGYHRSAAVKWKPLHQDPSREIKNNNSVFQSS